MSFAVRSYPCTIIPPSSRCSNAPHPVVESYPKHQETKVCSVPFWPPRIRWRNSAVYLPHHILLEGFNISPHVSISIHGARVLFQGSANTTVFPVRADPSASGTACSESLTLPQSAHYNTHRPIMDLCPFRLRLQQPINQSPHLPQACLQASQRHIDFQK